MRTSGIVVALVLLAGTAGAQEQKILAGERLFMSEGCYGCHTVGRVGTSIGPDLSRVGAKHSEEYLARWLHDPEAQRPHARMPKLKLDPAQVEALAAYLASLR